MIIFFQNLLLYCTFKKSYFHKCWKSWLQLKFSFVQLHSQNISLVKTEGKINKFELFVRGMPSSKSHLYLLEISTKRSVRSRKSCLNEVCDSGALRLLKHLYCPRKTEKHKWLDGGSARLGSFDAAAVAEEKNACWKRSASVSQGVEGNASETNVCKATGV